MRLIVLWTGSSCTSASQDGTPAPIPLSTCIPPPLIPSCSTSLSSGRHRPSSPTSFSSRRISLICAVKNSVSRLETRIGFTSFLPATISRCTNTTSHDSVSRWPRSTSRTTSHHTTSSARSSEDAESGVSSGVGVSRWVTYDGSGEIVGGERYPERRSGRQGDAEKQHVSWLESKFIESSDAAEKGVENKCFSRDISYGSNCCRPRKHGLPVFAIFVLV